MSQNRGRITRSLILKAVVAVVPMLLAVAPAVAANRQVQERTARKACLNGDYAKGVSILSDLFVDTKDPTYIFNQGRCFEQNRRYEDAGSRFEEYLRVAEGRLSPEDKAAAEKHIASCKEALAEQQGKTSTPTAPQPLSPPPPTAPPMGQATPAPEPSTPVLVQPEPQPAPVHDRKGLRTAGIVTAAVGGAALVTGVLLNLKVNSMINEMQTTPGGYSPSKENDRKTYKTLAWVGYGVGAVCVATGAILFGVGLKSGESSSTSLALLPAVGPGQAGALLTGGF